MVTIYVPYRSKDAKGKRRYVRTFTDAFRPMDRCKHDISFDDECFQCKEIEEVVDRATGSDNAPSG